MKLIKYVYTEKSKFLFEDYCPDGNIFSLLSDGSYTFEENGKTVKIAPPQGVLYLEGRNYHRKACGKMKLHIFRFEGDSNHFESSILKFYDTDRIKSNIGLLEKLSYAGVGNEGFSLEYAEHILNDILKLYQFENGVGKYVSGVEDATVARAMAEMEKNITNPLGIYELSEASGLSYVQFLRRFKLALGLTPAEYMARIRIKKAERLLSDSKLKIREIAPLCGFQDEYYFSNFFKKMLGLSPSEFRKNQNELQF